MKEKLARYSVFIFSICLLGASAGVVFWIARDEGARLAARERAALEAAEQAYRSETDAAAVSEAAASDDPAAAKKMFQEIDTLLSGLSSDDLPTED